MARPAAGANDDHARSAVQHPALPRARLADGPGQRRQGKRRLERGRLAPPHRPDGQPAQAVHPRRGAAAAPNLHPVGTVQRMPTAGGRDRVRAAAAIQVVLEAQAGRSDGQDCRVVAGADERKAGPVRRRGG
uniref:(northern house mosquito) hypothetical protein n=1 Tax=Culex pipiens TaxID=7175 RepID=A0A8D8HGV1_CULPI